MKDKRTILLAVLITVLMLLLIVAVFATVNEPIVVDPLFCGDCIRNTLTPTSRPTIPAPTDTPTPTIRPTP